MYWVKAQLLSKVLIKYKKIRNQFFPNNNIKSWSFGFIYCANFTILLINNTQKVIIIHALFDFSYFFKISFFSIKILLIFVLVFIEKIQILFFLNKKWFYFASEKRIIKSVIYIFFINIPSIIWNVFYLLKVVF